MLQLVHISKIIRNFAVENRENGLHLDKERALCTRLTEKEEYYKLITDEKSNHIGTNANGAGSQCVRRTNIGSLSFRKRYLSLRKEFSISLDSFFCLSYHFIWMVLKKTVSLQSIIQLKTMKKLLLLTVIVLQTLTIEAQSVRETILLDKGWKFMFGHAANPKKDFGCGTEYFNYLTKASSIHNEGPYVQKFDDSSWQEVQIPHDWVTTLPYAAEASHSHGYKTVGWKYPETSVGWYRKTLTIPAGDLGKRLLLRFDGIFRNATVWFNGYGAQRLCHTSIRYHPLRQIR